MSASEATLAVLQTQVQFEVAQSAAEVVRASALTARAQQQTTRSADHCEAFARELRAAMEGSRVNPALLDAMRRIYRIGQLELHEWQTRLHEAQQRERQARTALADLRNRERSLERARQAERRKRQLKEQTLEFTRYDEMWLLHACAGRS